MKEVQDRVVQFSNRYQLTNVATSEVLGTFDFDEVTGTVQQVGTEIDKELFDSIADDLAARVKLSGGELAGTIVTFSDISGTAANVASGDTSATLWGKVKNWFSRLKALAFKNKVAAGDFEAGAIKNADVAADADIAQDKVNGLMTDYVASISVSGRTVTYKNKNGANMGSITTQDTTYNVASQSSNGLMSSTDKTKLDGIDEALNNKANTSGSYPNLTVGNAEKLGNRAASEYALKRIYSTKTSVYLYKWESKTWNGKNLLYGSYVWTDGNDIYYSYGTAQHVLNRETSTWESKTWNGFSVFDSDNIWTDGENIYYSYRTSEYVLNRETSTWEEKSWNGGPLNFEGEYVWTDGENIYYSKYAEQYVLNKATSTWEPKTWKGRNSFHGFNIWTDGENIYYRDANVLNKATSTWEEKSWNGLTSFYGGSSIWTDGNDIYYSYGTDQYVLNRETSTWEPKTWNGLTSFSGSSIWTDGENIYLTNNWEDYKLTKVIPTTKTALRR